MKKDIYKVVSADLSEILAKYQIGEKPFNPINVCKFWLKRMCLELQINMDEALDLVLNGYVVVQDDKARYIHPVTGQQRKLYQKAAMDVFLEE